MNILEQKHFEVVTDLLMGLTAQKVAKDSTAITIEQMKGFAEWMDKGEIYKMDDGMWFNRITERKYLTTDELISAYIKTLS